MPMTTQDVCGAPDPHKVEWNYSKKKKNKKKDDMVRRVMNRVVKEESVDEAVDMNNQQQPGSWTLAKKAWNMMVQQGKVYPTDHEGLISFERFYTTYMNTHKGIEPRMQDIIDKFIQARAQQ